MVAPGGLNEMLRPKGERYQLMWQKRKGFVRLALKTQSPIQFAFCPKADDVFRIYQTPVRKISEKIAIPLAVLRGIGPTYIPNPVQLVHYISDPIIPPAWDGDEATVDRFHQEVLRKAEAFMQQAVASS